MAKNNRIGLSVEVTPQVLDKLSPGKHAVLYRATDWVGAVCALDRGGDGRWTLELPGGTRVALNNDAPRVNNDRIFLLESIKQKISRQRKGQSAIYDKASDIATFYGDTYYLSHSVIGSMQNGDHYFLVDGEQPQRLTFDRTALTIGARALEMKKDSPSDYAVDRATQRPVFLLARYHA